ncbi:MAG: hypothetical protein ACR2P1_09050 [Pseudomonadales bacterium]
MTKYIQSTAAITLTICLAVGLINYLVDPYCIYHFDSADADRLSRIDQFYHMRLSKPRHLLQLKPDAVIVGTSRSATIKPLHASWTNNRGYNLSAPGMTLYEMLPFIQHAHANGPLQKLMIGLDFEAFMTAEPQLRPGFAESRLAKSHEELASVAYARQSLTDSADTLLSLSALSRSAAALSGTGNASHRKYFRDGTWSTTSRFLVGKPGYVFVGNNRLAAHSRAKFRSGNNFSLFADILRFCQRQNIETRLFISPKHVFMIDLWYALGYAEDWQDFHQQLVALNKSVANEFNKEPFKLLGFNDASGIVDEPVYSPQESDNAWFQDGIHFRDQLGVKIMHSLWSDNESFGRVLNEESVASYLLNIDTLTTNFLDQKADVVNDIRERICRKTRIQRSAHENAKQPYCLIPLKL